MQKNARHTMALRFAECWTNVHSGALACISVSLFGALAAFHAARLVRVHARKHPRRPPLRRRLCHTHKPSAHIALHAVIATACQVRPQSSVFFFLPLARSSAKLGTLIGSWDCNRLSFTSGVSAVLPTGYEHERVSFDGGGPRAALAFR